MGAPIIPLSARLTRSTSRAWATGLRFLWRMPMPPARAMTMAERPSVTESMAALTRGMLSAIRRVNRVRTSTCAGRISLYAGTRRTSSKVRHSRSLSSSMGTSGVGASSAHPRSGGYDGSIAARASALPSRGRTKRILAPPSGLCAASIEPAVVDDDLLHDAEPEAGPVALGRDVGIEEHLGDRRRRSRGRRRRR